MLIILDLDGTIVDSQVANLNAFIKGLKKSNMVVTKELINNIKEGFGRPSLEILRDLFPNMNNVFVKVLRDSIRHIFRTEEINKVTIIPGVIDFLKNHDKDVLCIATSSPRDFTETILKNLDLEKYFKIVVTSDDVSKGKPDPEILNKIIKETGVDKKNAVFIGDSSHDLRCADNAGIRFIGVISKSFNPEEIIKSGKEYYKDLGSVKL